MESRVSQVIQINSEKGRRYQTPDGVFPSVTTILSATKSERDKKALDDWRNKVGPEEADRISKQSTTDGTLMHSCFEGLSAFDHRMLSLRDAYELIDKDETGANKERIKGFVNQWHEHIREKLGATYFLEEYGWNPKHGYAGAIDHIGEFEGIPSVVDWKNSTKAKKDEWIHDYKLQGAAYIGMCYRCPVFAEVPPVKQFVCVVFNDETSEPQIFRYVLQDILRTYWPQWEARVKLWHSKNKV